jgi:preprotein translocase subunit SecA
MELYNEKEETIGEERFREIERAVLLQNVDRNWMEHIDAMDDLKDSIRLQSYAQRDPVNEYRLQGADMFDAMVADIRERTARMILSVTIKTPEVKRVQLAKPLQEGFEGADGAKTKKVTVAKRSAPTVGRNDLCPCGSGKKYKKCCGAPGATQE